MFSCNGLILSLNSVYASSVYPRIYTYLTFWFSIARYNAFKGPREIDEWTERSEPTTFGKLRIFTLSDLFTKAMSVIRMEHQIQALTNYH